MLCYIIFAVMTGIFLCKWAKWKIVSLALVYYMEKNQYKQPNDEEMQACTDFVIKNSLKDLIGH